MKNIIITFMVVIIVFIVGGFTNQRADWAEDVKLIDSAFNITGAIPLSYNVNAWVKVNDEPYNLALMTEIGQEIISLGEGLIHDYETEVIDDANTKWLNLYSRGPYGSKLNISIKSLEDGQYAVINASGSVKDKLLYTIASYMEKALGRYGNEVHVDVALSGHMDGKLSVETFKGIYGDILKMLYAKPVEGIDDGELVSLTGYSPRIRHYVESGYKKMNVQAAMRYDSLEGQTYIWLGMPLITVGY